jgi:hypothetical protein
MMEQGRRGEWAKGRWQQATSSKQQAAGNRQASHERAKGRMGKWAKGREGERQQQPERLESIAQRNALWIGKHLKNKPQSGRNRQKAQGR